MRSQPRVLIAVSLLAASVPWDLERLDATGPLQASYGIAAPHSADAARAASLRQFS